MGPSSSGAWNVPDQRSRSQFTQFTLSSWLLRHKGHRETVRNCVPEHQKDQNDQSSHRKVVGLSRLCQWSWSRPDSQRESCVSCLQLSQHKAGKLLDPVHQQGIKRCALYIHGRHKWDTCRTCEHWGFTNIQLVSTCRSLTAQRRRLFANRQQTEVSRVAMARRLVVTGPAEHCSLPYWEWLYQATPLHACVWVYAS